MNSFLRTLILLTDGDVGTTLHPKVPFRRHEKPSLDVTLGKRSPEVLNITSGEGMIPSTVRASINILKYIFFNLLNFSFSNCAIFSSVPI